MVGRAALFLFYHVLLWQCYLDRKFNQKGFFLKFIYLACALSYKVFN